LSNGTIFQGHDGQDDGQHLNLLQALFRLQVMKVLIGKGNKDSAPKGPQKIE